MTTFVPLAPDTYGTLSAVAVGDWLLQMIKLWDPERMKIYYDQFLLEFFKDEAGDQKIRNPSKLIDLLLSQHEMVFSHLQHVKQSHDILYVSCDQNQQKVENKKTFVEVSREVEEYFTVLMSMIALRIEDEQQAAAAAMKMCDALTADSFVPEFRLRMLKALYNVFIPKCRFRFSIFLKILEYSAKMKLFNQVLPYIQYIGEWQKDWDLDAPSKRYLYLLISQQFRATGNDEEAYPHLKTHVENYAGEPLEVLNTEEAILAAVELAVLAINLPDVMYFDNLVELDAVQHLRNTKHCTLVELVDIFLRGGPSDLKSFHNRSPDVFVTYGVSFTDSLKKIQLLSVASYSVGKNEIQIFQLATFLGLAVRETEEVVVQAIGQGLVDASIDQINAIVKVKSAMHREFTGAQWEQLHNKMEWWMESVKLLGSIQPRTSSVSPLLNIVQDNNSIQQAPYNDQHDNVSTPNYHQNSDVQHGNFSQPLGACHQ